ncbi:hypothetical protein AB0L40_25685 [Patulibacter sp. NPDC049589]|uniref:hypothetical protein n=1 Tax=Patulibacter sp. NPDC049589 TaxID=3154731 RepID=UPI003414E012
MTDGTQEPEETAGPEAGATADGTPPAAGADAATDPATTPGAADAPDDADLPPLAPHLRDRYDRPRGASEIAKGRSQARLILLLLFAALPVVVLVVVVLNSLASGPPDDRAVLGERGGLNEVTRYCVYTTRNDGQYDDCLKRTDPRVIRKEQSNGARYARGELTRCLAAR